MRVTDDCDDRAWNPSGVNVDDGRRGFGMVTNAEPEGGPSLALNKATRILTACGEHQGWIQLKDLAVRSGLPRSTVHRLAASLVALGFLSTDGRGNYSLGLRLVELGALALAGLPLTSLCASYVQEIVDELNETTHVSVLDGADAVYILRAASRNRISVDSHVGQRIPAHCTASGLALLAYQPEIVVSRALRPPLRRHSGRTVVDPETIRQELQAIRQRGYSANFGQLQEDIWGVAAPIISDSGTSVGAIGVAVPAYRINADDLHSWGARLRSIADEISDELGGSAGQPKIARRS
jgi:DNA-binding IclR family transcriptional regulator